MKKTIMTNNDNIKRAAEAISKASALIFTAGAGMGVDSGLPDFRGRDGFWKAYPAFEHIGVNFEDVANPECFERNPRLAWGFYGHRLNMYRKAVPHEGYSILNRLAKMKNHFICTSNVDGAFQKSGFPDHKIWEVHGSIHHLQPTKPNYTVTWEEAEKIIISADGFEVEIDKNCHAKGDLPNLDGELLRPNIVMFCDFGWMPVREEAQHQSYVRWRNASDLSRLVVIESGAGTQIPTMRFFGEELADSNNGTLIRINPNEKEAQISSHLWDNLNDKTGIPIVMRGKDALIEIEKEVLRG